ncbi:MAG TPA: beta-phosphoglucomutase family hydrolase [Actinomycetota bacterium]|nr:beta-phosphoglucomutase family hydrolase [Actinomycetota bacterium]
MTSPRLALPDHVTACLFDLDGVLTQTAKVHAAAWKQMFDEYLARNGQAPLELPDEYVRYIDGKLREDGVVSFLQSRGLTLPQGSPDDPPSAETVHGLANRKNVLVTALLERHGVEVYGGSVRFVEAARAAGLRRGVVSASKNCRAVLRAAGIEHLFEVRVDGIVAATEGLRGKPAPDTFLAAARLLDVPPRAAAVFEDAEAGVEAGSTGGFGYVVGVDRADNAQALKDRGADVVVSDLADLLEERP